MRRYLLIVPAAMLAAILLWHAALVLHDGMAFRHYVANPGCECPVCNRIDARFLEADQAY